MEISLASAFVRYVYTGKTTLVFDQHNDEYDLEVAPEDEVSIRVTGSKVEIRPSDSNETFVATTTDKKYLRLMKYSEAEEFVFVPHPKKPCYPFIPKITFEMLPKLYDYFNKLYFNGMCPKSLLFKRSPKRSELGLAQLDPNVRGKPLYRMTVNMKIIASDTMLFIDTFLHEMIHLYLFRKGLEERNVEYTNDGHGKFFQSEMRRLNKFGFNISIVVDWEKRVHNEDAELQVIHVTSPQLDAKKYNKYYWSDKNLEEDFVRIATQIMSTGSGADLIINLRTTTNAHVRGFPKLSATSKVPASKLSLWWGQIELGGRLIRTLDSRTEARTLKPVATQVTKKEEPQYAQSYRMFTAYMKRQYMENSEDRLHALWHHFPIAKIVPHAEAELLDVAKGIKRGVNDAETKRRLTNVFARFDDRCNQYEYRQIINKIIDKHKLDVLLNYPQLGL